jgi:uncharacterized Zn finger protein (UPF0148 family)
MTRYPRAGHNTRLECDCGAPVVKDDGEYVCTGCGRTVSEDEESTDRAPPRPETGRRTERPFKYLRP